MTLPPKLLCPSCRGTRLVLGAPDPFPGFGSFKLLGKLFGYTKYPVACLDCGFIGQSLCENDRRKLIGTHQGTYRDI